MDLTVGMTADITLQNVTVAELSTDGAWVRVNLQPDADNQIVSVWIPNDNRIDAEPNVPANWPPLEGDVWGLISNPTIQAWVVNDGKGNLYFVTEANVRNRTTPISTAQALANFGSDLSMLFRKT